MTYRDRLKYWAIMQQLLSLKWVVVDRFRNRADADGHLQILKQQEPAFNFQVVFDVLDD